MQDLDRRLIYGRVHHVVGVERRGRGHLRLKGQRLCAWLRFVPLGAGPLTSVLLRALDRKWNA